MGGGWRRGGMWFKKTRHGGGMWVVVTLNVNIYVYVFNNVGNGHALCGKNYSHERIFIKSELMIIC